MCDVIAKATLHLLQKFRAAADGEGEEGILVDPRGEIPGLDSLSDLPSFLRDAARAPLKTAAAAAAKSAACLRFREVRNSRSGLHRWECFALPCSTLPSQPPPNPLPLSPPNSHGGIGMHTRVALEAAGAIPASYGGAQLHQRPAGSGPAPAVKQRRKRAKGE